LQGSPKVSLTELRTERTAQGFWHVRSLNVQHKDSGMFVPFFPFPSYPTDSLGNISLAQNVCQKDIKVENKV